MTTIEAPSANRSCWARAQNCLCENQVCKKGKFLFWGAGSIASAFIPVPFLKGFLVGSMFFMSVHEMCKLTPPSGKLRRLAETRSWKHIVTGAAISGVSGGLGSLSSSLVGSLSLSLFGSLSSAHIVFPIMAFPIYSVGVGVALSFAIAYSNTRCRPVASQREYKVLLPTISEGNESKQT